MADEQEAIATDIEQEAPAIETEATIEQTAADEPQRTDDLTDEATEETLVAEPEAVEPDLIEIEWDDGNKYQIPKALEAGLLKNKDYTEKTQSISRKAKELESREAAINQRLEATEEELDARASLRTIDAQLAEYAKLTKADWDYHGSVDPVATENAWRNYQMLKEQRGETAKTLETRQAERTEKAQQDLAKRVQETAAFAQKEIPGWKPELTDTLVKFAYEIGVPEDAVKANWSPVFYKLLHRAHIGELALKRQATAPKPAPAPVQPLATVGGKTTPAARGDLGSADMESYIAMRNKGVGGKPIRADR